MEKKTPLYDTHLKYGGKIVEFGGFLLPVLGFLVTSAYYKLPWYYSYKRKFSE